MFGGAPPPSHRREPETTISGTTEGGTDFYFKSSPEGNSAGVRTPDGKVRIDIDENEFYVNGRSGSRLGVALVALAGVAATIGFVAHQLISSAK